MRKTVVDFETFYDTQAQLSVKTIGLHNYARRADAYIVSVVNEDVEYCGPVAEMPKALGDTWMTDPDMEFFAANSNFDQRFWEKYYPKTARPWRCVLDKAAFHQLPRALAAVAEVHLHKKLDKDARREMDGVRWEGLGDEQQQRLINYCLEDSITERDIEESLGPMSPVEQELAAHTRLINRRCVHINVEKLDRDITLLEQVRFEACQSIPWAEGDDEEKPLSYPRFCKWVATHGSQPPLSLDKRDERCRVWIGENPTLAPVLQHMRVFRGANAKMKKLRLMQINECDGVIPLDFIYCGARHTRRWSSQSINLQNLDAARAFEKEMAELPFFKENPGETPGIFMREYVIPPPGRKLGILDFSQIEPRCLNWLVGNCELLDAIRAGYGIYEAHALASMGWKGLPGTLKASDPKLYKYAKERVLALGYGMGWALFQARVKLNLGLDLTEAQSRAAVADFRATNRKITGLWHRLDALAKEAAYDRETKTLELVMPTGDVLRHFHIRGKGKGQNGCCSYTIQGDFSQQSIVHNCWGGTLAENVTQRMARDVLGAAILKLEKAGFPVLFHAHDEVILALDEQTAQADFIEARRIMSQPPEWCADLPLGADGAVTDHYVKLA